MRKFLILFGSLVLLLVGAAIIHAQEATAVPDAGWPVEERCVSAPTKPPKGWSYDGTILMKGHAGIHGVNAKWDRPHVVVPLGIKDVQGGALSPDGKWYASPYGRTDRDPKTYDTITSTQEIRVYSTSSSEKYVINIPAAQFSQGDYGQIHWRDNNHFAYRTSVEQTLLIDPFTGKNEPIEALNSLFGQWLVSIYSYLSYDWTRVVYRQHTPSDGDWHIIDLRNGDEPKTLSLWYYSIVVWMPDSSHFVAEVDNPSNSDSWQKLVLFDQDGNFAETLFNTDKKYQIRDKAWSSDGRYLAFSEDTYVPTHVSDRKLYIADFKQHQIIEPCIKVGVGLAWSPDNSKIAFLNMGEGQQPVEIYVLEAEKVYRVAYHTGSVVGWRAD